LCTGGTAGIWAMDLFSTTYFGENIIFGLSKDQTFRIRCTLMNPAKFLILVTHLMLQKGWGVWLKTQFKGNQVGQCFDVSPRHFERYESALNQLIFRSEELWLRADSYLSEWRGSAFAKRQMDLLDSGMEIQTYFD
jgi:hypothetical protein